MPRLTEQEQQEIVRFIQAGRPLQHRVKRGCSRLSVKTKPGSTSTGKNLSAAAQSRPTGA